MTLNAKDRDDARMFMIARVMAAGCFIGLFAACAPELDAAPQERPVISEAWKPASSAEALPSVIAIGAGVRDTWTSISRSARSCQLLAVSD